MVELLLLLFTQQLPSLRDVYVALRVEGSKRFTRRSTHMETIWWKDGAAAAAQHSITSEPLIPRHAVALSSSPLCPPLPPSFLITDAKQPNAQTNS